jgi:prepilin-type N-terminal cleavage/methylation domain-containing protein
MLEWLSKRFVRAESGFTLIEMMMAMVVVTLLTTAFATIVTAMIKHSTEISGESVSQTQARSSIDELAQDLRQAYVGDGTNGIESISSTAITFDSPDRATPFHLRRISYQLTGGKLQRQLTTSTNTNGPPWTWGTVGPWATRVESVTSPTVFTAYSDYAGGTTTTTASSVRAVTFGVAVSNPGSQGKTYTYSGSASLRSSP